VRSRIVIAVTVVLAFAAWTVTAAAGNPHGTPPGQQQASGSTAVGASSNAHVPVKAQGKAHAKGSVAVGATVKAQGHAASSTKTTGRARAAARSSVHASTASSGTVQTPTSAGVKPSSTTNVTLGHNTTAPASSNMTKLYGNGQTAGQIATQAGFGGSTLYGPGNSQPHKVNCGPHMVDVHALKAHAAKCAAAAAAAGLAASVSAAVSAQPSVAASAAAQAPTTAAAAQAAAAAKGAEASAKAKPGAHKGGVLGAKAELASATKRVSRAILATARKGMLPFTGFGLWLPIVLGLGLIAGGYGLRRRAGLLS
jgi:hypothetical protein